MIWMKTRFRCGWTVLTEKPSYCRLSARGRFVEERVSIWEATKMAKKSSKSESSEVTEFSEESTASVEEIIEFDETTVESSGLAEVQDLSDEPSVTMVDDAMFEALSTVERQIGGFEAVQVAMDNPEDVGAAGAENVVGFGVGEKIVNGEYTGELAVKVYVVEKLPLSQVAESVVVPSSVGAYPTDVEAVGEVSALSFRRRYRPAPGGSSIGHPDITAGTHGAIVVLNNNRLCGLSNNHVLANSNAANIGDWIIQPGTADGGKYPRDRVGVLERFVPIDFGGRPNTVDAAALWTNFSYLSARHHCYQINTRPVLPALNMMVRKCGRTTQHTLGFVSGVGVSVRVSYGASGTAVFRNQILIRGIGGDFSRGGDSGSLVVTAGSRQPVGLLFAGGGGATFANRIDVVIAAMGIRRFLNTP